MKGTELFKAAIQNYLEYRAMTDDLFASRYANPAKNIDDCITYILNEVQKSGMNGFDDDEITTMMPAQLRTVVDNACTDACPNYSVCGKCREHASMN